MYETIMTGIATVGFPIMACLALAWFCYTLVNRLLAVVEENTKAMAEMKDAVTKLTAVQNRQIDLIDREE